MRNKRGFIFPLYVVLLTMMMCGIVIMLYLNQQDNVASSLVSPLAVLELRDDLEIFEMREVDLIKSSLSESEFEASVLKSKFVDGLDGNMKDFVLENLYWNDAEMIRGSFDENAFFENVLYSVEERSRDLVLKRSIVGKRFILSSINASEINFPIDFSFDFEREYLISKVGNEVVVTKN